MLTNILLGLILMTLIIIICGKYSTILELKAILIRVTSIQESLKQSEATQHRIDCKLIELMPKKENSTKEYLKEYYNVPDVKEGIIQDCLSREAQHNPVVKEKIHRMAGLPMREDCPITVVREQPKPKKKVNKEYERKIADGFFEDLVVKILKEKREKMCSTVDILKRHRTTMNTFKRHATKEQIAELMALQVETKKQSVDKQRQNIYHKRS